MTTNKQAEIHYKIRELKKRKENIKLKHEDNNLHNMYVLNQLKTEVFCDLAKTKRQMKH